MLRRRDIDRMVRLENEHYFETALKKGRGAILVLPHLGNWELGGVAVSRHGYPLSSIARPMENRLLNRHLDSLRSEQNQIIIAKYNASARMAQELKSNRLLALLVDQHAGSKGLWVDFFGRPASTVKSPAILSLRYRSPIIPLKVVRDNGRHRVVMTEPIYPDQFRTVEELTQAFTRRIELFVREHPEQWFWLHRRWKTPPPCLKSEDANLKT
jgi:KDO2-lipid IV(A) lauroyltransferase